MAAIQGHVVGFGVYFHLPYCRQHCPYCDFSIQVVRRGEPPWGELRSALKNELEVRAPGFFEQSVATVYFGGGTPSLAPTSLIGELLGEVDRRWGLSSDAEVTLEVDPNTVGVGGLGDFHAAGVNRISLGWQSTHSELLRTLGRGHDGPQSRQCFADAREAGFENISVDLILAVPGQSLEQLDGDLDVIDQMAPEHVSVYGLTWEPRSTFTKLRDRGRLHALPEDLELAMMDRVESRLPASGLQRYEVSNYARSGYFSRHNSSYWDGSTYLGVGPGANSFLRSGWERGWRWESVRHPRRYIRHWASGSSGRRTDGLPVTTSSSDPGVEWAEELSGETLIRERVMCGLRTTQGLSRSEFGPGDFPAELEASLSDAKTRGWIDDDGKRFRPTALGLRFNDGLARLVL